MADLHNDISHEQIRSRTLNICSKTPGGAEHILRSVHGKNWLPLPSMTLEHMTRLNGEFHSTKIPKYQHLVSETYFRMTPLQIATTITHKIYLNYN